MKISDVTYTSPVMRYDPQANVLVFVRRNPSTGQVAYQVPSEREVAQRREDQGVPPTSLSDSSIQAQGQAGTAIGGRSVPPSKVEPASPTPGMGDEAVITLRVSLFA